MKSASVLLIFASALIVGCAGSSPLSPTAASISSGASLVSNAASPAGPRPFFPPINPAGISCPSDAPQLMLGSLAMRLDIEFSEVAGAYAYEIEIMNYVGAITRLQIDAPAHRAEWYGVPGMYRVRVRTINCGGLGNWSAELYQTLDDGIPPPPPPVVPPPVVPPPVEPPVVPPPVVPPPVVPPSEPPMEPQCMMGCF